MALSQTILVLAILGLLVGLMIVEARKKIGLRAKRRQQRRHRFSMPGTTDIEF